MLFYIALSLIGASIPVLWIMSIVINAPLGYEDRNGFHFGSEPREQ
jgi:hypothetical protein